MAAASASSRRICGADGCTQQLTVASDGRDCTFCSVHCSRKECETALHVAVRTKVASSNATATSSTQAPAPSSVQPHTHVAFPPQQTATDKAPADPPASTLSERARATCTSCNAQRNDGDLNCVLCIVCCSTGKPDVPCRALLHNQLKARGRRPPADDPPAAPNLRPPPHDPNFAGPLGASESREQVVSRGVRALERTWAPVDTATASASDRNVVAWNNFHSALFGDNSRLLHSSITVEPPITDGSILTLNTKFTISPALLATASVSFSAAGAASAATGGTGGGIGAGPAAASVALARSTLRGRLRALGQSARDILIGYAIKRKNGMTQEAYGQVVAGSSECRPGFLHVWLQSFTQGDTAAWDEGGEGSVDIGPIFQLSSSDFAVWWGLAWVFLPHAQRLALFPNLVRQKERELLSRYSRDLVSLSTWRRDGQQLAAATATAQAMKAITAAQSSRTGGAGGGGGGGGHGGGGKGNGGKGGGGTGHRGGGGGDTGRGGGGGGGQGGGGGRDNGRGGGGGGRGGGHTDGQQAAAAGGGGAARDGGGGDGGHGGQPTGGGDGGGAGGNRRQRRAAARAAGAAGGDGATR